MARRRKLLATVPFFSAAAVIFACSSSTFSGGDASTTDAAAEETSLTDSTPGIDDGGAEADAPTLLPDCPPVDHGFGVDTLAAYEPSSGNFTWSDCFSANLSKSYVFVNLYPYAFAGAWDGTGVDAPGDYDPSTATFHLVRATDAGDLDVGFGGPAKNVPVAGDWNGDKFDTIGFYYVPGSTFFLNDANTSGSATYVVPFGVAKDGGADLVPVIGDWDGDGDDTIGIYDPDLGKFYLRNALAGGAADVTFSFGGPNRVPLAGDWDGDGRSGVGTYDPATGIVELENVAGAKNVDYRFTIDPNLHLVSGDWDGK